MSDDITPPGRHLTAFALMLLAETPDHGRQLHRRMNEVLPKSLSVDNGNLYRALRELETKGMLRSAWNTEDCGPAKRTYEVTADGMSELIRWRADMTDRRDAFDWFLRHSEALLDIEQGAPKLKDRQDPLA
ncbi:MAG: PadR family transcriptional regulator [Acidiferrobacter sp.]